MHYQNFKVCSIIVLFSLLSLNMLAQVHIDSTGKVGIGTTNPQAGLHIHAPGDGARVLILGTERNWTFEQEGTGSGTSLRLRNTYGPDKQFSIDTDGKTRFRRRDGSSTGVIIDHLNAKIGIGTLTPASSLDIGGGNIALSGGWISNDGDDEGISVDDDGKVGIGGLPQSNARFYATANSPLNSSVAEFRSITSGLYSLMVTGHTDSEVFRIRNHNFSPVFSVFGDGRVGIGTQSPSQAKVVIDGSAENTLSYGYLNSSGNTGTSSGTNDYSLYASDRISASEFNAHSDVRIKHIMGQSNGGQDLKTLMDIEITNYVLIDSLAKGKKPYKKVIAQQVAEVYPQAVSANITEVVPDIYQRAKTKDGWILLTTDLRPGERVKIITEKNAEVYEVVEVKSDRFYIESETSRQLPENVFVYGREVHDFHTVDYEAISMLNVSATQEQQRRIEKLEAENNMLKKQIEELGELKELVQQLQHAFVEYQPEADSQ